MKPLKKNNVSASRFIVPLLAVLLATPFTVNVAMADGETLYWSNNRSPETRNMMQVENWSNFPSFNDNADAPPSSTANLIFNVNSLNASDQTPQMAGNDRTFGSMTFLSSGTTQIDRGANTSTNSSVLTLSGGITVEEGAGAVNFGRSGQTVWMRASEDMTITHNSSNTLNFHNRWEAAAANDTTTILTVDGSGSGQVRFNLVRDRTTDNIRLGLTVDRDVEAGFVTLQTGTYSGPTMIQSGTFRLGEDTPGSLTGSDVTVTGNGRIINRGTITDGDLHFAPGGGLGVNPNLTLTVNGSGTVSFDDFGVNNLTFTTIGGWDDLDLFSPYTLIAGSALFDFTGLLNVGIEEAVQVGSMGRSAYFQEGSLQLVVIPEANTFGLVAATLLVTLFVRRRFK